MSLDKTFQILLQSKRTDAPQVLANGVLRGDAGTRDRCIETLAHRDDPRSHEALTRLWSDFREHIIAKLDSCETHSVAYFSSIVEQLQDPNTTDELVGVHRDIAATFHLTDALPRLIDIAWKHQSRELRESTLNAVIAICQQWGNQARRNYAGLRPSPTLERSRLAAMTQLHAAAQDFQSHRCESLLDAFLLLSNWNDPTLQAVFKQDNPCRKLIVRRLRSSGNLGIMELLAGYFRRRSIPDSVIGTVLQRSDAAYREVLLRAISPKPSNTIVNNLNEFGLPDCLRGGVELLRELGTDRDAAIAHVYSSAMNQNPETLLVLLEIVERHSPDQQNKDPENKNPDSRSGPVSSNPPNPRKTDKESLASAKARRDRTLEAATTAFSRIAPPSIQFWLHAMNSPIMDGDVVESEIKQLEQDNDDQPAIDPQSETAAVICTGLVDLAVGEDCPLARHAADLLTELSIHRTLPLFASLSDAQRLRLGRVLMQIDTSTIDVIRDGLRHAVMQRRLEAIEFAQTLGLVDLMLEPFTTIAKTDHQTVRLATAAALGYARSEESADLLRLLSTSQQPSLRDTALASLNMRGIVT